MTRNKDQQRSSNPWDDVMPRQENPKKEKTGNQPNLGSTREVLPNVKKEPKTTNTTSQPLWGQTREIPPNIASTPLEGNRLSRSQLTNFINGVVAEHPKVTAGLIATSITTAGLLAAALTLPFSNGVQTPSESRQTPSTILISNEGMNRPLFVPPTPLHTFDNNFGCQKRLGPVNLGLLEKNRTAVVIWAFSDCPDGVNFMTRAIPIDPEYFETIKG